MPFSIGSSRSRPRYSLHWADSVIKSTSEKHPRGLKFFAWFTRLSPDHLAFILARNQGEWHVIRRAIANLERIYDLRDNFHHDDDYLAINLMGSMEVFENNAQNCDVQTFADWSAGLTARRIENILEEPIEKGGMVRSESDESSLPSLFRREVILDAIRRREEATSFKNQARREALRASE